MEERNIDQKLVDILMEMKKEDIARLVLDVLCKAYKNPTQIKLALYNGLKPKVDMMKRLAGE